MNKNCYTGKHFTNSLIAFWAKDKDPHDLIAVSALFQSLVASFWYVHTALLVEPSLIRSPLVIDRVVLLKLEVLHFKLFNEEFLLFTAFQTSVSLIWALVWFTDNMFTFLSKILVFIFSKIFFRFKNLSNLFWVFCNSFMIFFFGGVYCVLSIMHLIIVKSTQNHVQYKVC